MSEIGPKQGSLFGTRAKPNSKPPASAPASVSTEAQVRPPDTDPLSPRPLFIGPVERGSIKALIERARQHPVGLAETQRRAAERKRGMTSPPSLNRQFTIKIPWGFVATYTIEEEPLGWTRHLAVATDRERRAPDAAVNMLLREFGFRAASVGQIEVGWFEPIGNDRQAVNLVEYIEATAAQAGGAEDYIPDPDAEPPEE